MLNSIFIVSLLLLSTHSLSETKWQIIADQDGITTYKQVGSESAVVAFKGEAMIDAPLAKVTSMMTDADNLIKWLPSTAEVRPLKQISKSQWLVYDRAKVPAPFDDRDFVLLYNIEINPDTQTVKLSQKSIEDPAYPPNPQYVRANLLYNTYTMESRENGTKTFVTLELACDPKGNLPLFVVNAFQGNSPREMLEAMKKRVASPEVTINPKVIQALQKPAK